MNQLSFFGVDTAPPALSDLDGLLAAHGTATLTPEGAQLTVVVGASWRASALAARITDIGATAEVTDTPEGICVRTAPDPVLVPAVRRWVHGTAKRVPDGWVPTHGALRVWYVAAGRMEADGERYVLGLDPVSPGTYAPLVRALMRVGVAPTLICPHGTTPGLRIAGRRRLARLADSVGAPPDDPAARALWPHAEQDGHHV